MSFLSVALLLVTGGGAWAAAPVRVGINFVRYQWGNPGQEPLPVEETSAGISKLKVDAMRQIMRADLVWRDVEPQDGVWTFDRADRVLNDPPAEPVVTLFSLQYASATPHWVSGRSPFERTVGPAARDYVETVVRRYAEKVRYWEIGNEMDHWRIADPGAKRKPGGRQPPHVPSGGFTPEQQGRFVAEVAAIIRENDSDAVILMPGIAGLSPYVLETWLPGFVKGAGVDGFDVVGYHFYGPWSELERRRLALGATLKRLGVSDKPVWLTETGSTSDPSLRFRTDYPNSDESQAADVFRRIVTAWASGDEAAFWHSYLGSPNRPRNRWRGYGLVSPDGQRKRSFATMRLLSDHLGQFKTVALVSGLSRGQHGYHFVLENGSHRWVYWGRGTVTAPNSPPAKGFTAVVAGEGARHTWRAVPAQLPLSPVPILLRN
ncbi:MAG: endo-1,4-beta-xylanase [Deltaproteobacteria bacterium]|nr:endo-1,4-beta-xylanase [Deltaproteobacteria bacterium]